MPGLYPKIEPYDSGHIQVSTVHQVYYEQCGNPDGKPVLVVHGGPGGGCQESTRRFFDPLHYRVILVDQRGCGRSLPFCCLEDNNTQALIADFEMIRQRLRIDQWMLFGGSWGTTLSLAYAQSHPDSISQMIFRGVFLATPEEMTWLFRAGGASKIYPEAWQQFVAGFSSQEQDNILQAYCQRFEQLHEEELTTLARQCCRWETTIARLISDPERIERDLQDDSTLSYARIISHYASHDFFLPHKLIDNLESCRHIPLDIVHGRHDVICPPATAWRLHQAWPSSRLHMVADGAHAAMEPSMINALVALCDQSI